MTLNVVANAIWLLLTIISVAAFLFVTRSSEGRGLSATVTVPAWAVVVMSFIGIGTAIFVFITTRKASVVRGRDEATKANVDLLASRSKIDPSSQVIRSTRFGRWPPKETFPGRTNFRQELDKAIMEEAPAVKRIWNVSSADDVKRLRDLLDRYKGHDNHSIRAYFGVADHLLPELLVVDKCGASISFSSTKTRTLSWAICMKRADLIDVIKDYFEGLWDRAEKILDSGEVTTSGQAALKKFEAGLREP